MGKGPKIHMKKLFFIKRCVKEENEMISDLDFDEPIKDKSDHEVIEKFSREKNITGSLIEENYDVRFVWEKVDRLVACKNVLKKVAKCMICRAEI
ncbi:13314_t:CDS:2 [Entrophospora sp. SA101]|nr:13314_t:CDS:2 [Entrophospora sp. SA101]